MEPITCRRDMIRRYVTDFGDNAEHSKQGKIDLEDIMKEFSLYVSESKYCQYYVLHNIHNNLLT